MPIKLSTAIAAAGLCLIVVGLAIADGTVSDRQTAVKLYRGTSVIAASDPKSSVYVANFTPAACELLREARWQAEAATRTSGTATYKCQVEERAIVAFIRPVVTPPPPTCPAAPASQTRQISCPANFTGSYTERSTSTVGAPPACTVTTTWEVVPPGNGACIPVSQPPTNALFFDRFEYDVDRAGNADLFRQRGYSHVKAENSVTNRGGSGYIYTLFNQALGSRVLVLESRPTMSPPPGDFPYSQTDYYLQLGNESGSGTAVPANAWIQFWTYATPESRFATRDKTIYPCRGSYPCHPTWLFMWGSGGFEGVSAPAGGRYLALEGIGAQRDTRVNDGQGHKLFQNVSRTPLLAGRWYQVRLHIDISQAQGVYEAWIKEPGQTSFTKIASWGPTTPNFSWPVANRSGYNIVRIPTTVNQSNNTVYIDDFVIAGSQDALPN